MRLNLNHLLFCLVLTLMFLACSKDTIGPDNNQLNQTKIGLRSDEVCVTTFNAFLLDTEPIGVDLPAGPQCDGIDCINRALEICSFLNLALSDSDVIMLQEVWVEEAGEALIECMTIHGYTYNTGFDSSSGLITFSKKEIVTTNFVEFDAEHGVTSCGNDQWKDKGFLHTKIDIGECNFDFINTHLDAGECPLDLVARADQLAQIRTYIYRHIGDDGYILGGDINIDFSSPEFSRINSILGATTSFDGLGVAPGASASGGNSLLDYLLYDDNGTVTPTSYLEGFGGRYRYCYYTFTQDFFDSLSEEEIYDIFVELHGEPDIGPNDDLGITVPRLLATWGSLSDVPLQYQSVVEQICSERDLDHHNPSDHSPITSCFEIECDDDSTNNNGGNNGGPTTGCVPKCPPNHDCINGECVPH